MPRHDVRDRVGDVFRFEPLDRGIQTSRVLANIRPNVADQLGLDGPWLYDGDTHVPRSDLLT